MASKRFRDALGVDPDRVISAAVDAALGDTQARSRKKHHPGRVLAAGAAVAAAAAVGQRRMPRVAKVPLRMGLHKLGDMTHVDELADALRDRLAGHFDEPEDDGYYDDEEVADDEEYDDDEEFEDEPRDEADDEDFDEDDDDFDDEPEDEDGPRGEGDEVDDEELEDDEPEDEVDDLPDEEPEDDEAEDDEPADEEDDDVDEDDEQIAARSLDLGVRSTDTRDSGRARVPDLFAALRTPQRRAPVMRRGSLRVDPATRPPQPDQRPRETRQSRSKKPTSKAARA
jgi:hypothetical protein